MDCQSSPNKAPQGLPRKTHHVPITSSHTLQLEYPPVRNHDVLPFAPVTALSATTMPAQAHAPASSFGALRNDQRYPSSSGVAQTQNQSRTGPSHGSMAHPSPLAPMQPTVPGSSGSAASSTVAPLPEPAAIPTFSHVPYFTAIQIETLYARRRGARMSASTWQANRDMATGFIQSVASRLGFPQRSIATAQQIYQRFHLFYPPSDFVLHEIAVASLFVAAKLNDTHKKPRDLLLASYALRFPQLVKGNAAAAEPNLPSAPDESPFPVLAGHKRKHATATAGDISIPSRPLAMAIGGVGEADIDPNILETDRKRLMALEKLILESLCFNFHSNANTAFKMVIKLGRRSKLPKSFIRTSWKIVADMFRTTAPMQYPPNVVAVAALYAAALLARPPPHMTSRSQQELDVPQGHENHVGDPLVAFLTNISSVSATPAPRETSASQHDPNVIIPLSEPFPGCDPEVRIHVEDVEEAVHELFDLYLACAAQLPPSLYMTSASGLGPSYGYAGSAAATPSPLSPADHLDAFNASPSSSAGLSDPASQQPVNARKKLKQYEYSPPPFALVAWLNSTRCTQLQQSLHASSKVETGDGTRKSGSANQVGTAASQFSTDPTLPTKELSALLTDLKIYLRGLEYDRQRADDAYLAERNILAEVEAIPLPTSDLSLEAAAVQTAGMLGVPAHSVAIHLRPLNEARSGAQSVDPVTTLSKRESEVVERIRRRKLVSALRLMFVEPEVEKRPDMSVEAVPRREQLRHQAKQLDTASAVATTIANEGGETIASTKRNRIELAKRYLF